MSVSDSFSRADANPAGAPWTTVTGWGAMKIVSNVMLAATDGTDSGAVETGHSWNSDQSSQVTITSSGSGDAGLLLCFNSSSKNGYACAGNTESKIYRVDAGAFTLLDSNGTGWNGATNAVILFEKVGSALTIKVNGVLQVSSTDATYSAGNPGIYNFGSGNTFDNWVGTGEIGGGGNVSVAGMMF